MPTPCPPPYSTPARRLTAGALLSAALVLGATAVPAQAGTGGGTAPTGSTPTAGTATGATARAAVRGVLDRLISEPPSTDRRRTATTTAWLRTGTARIPLDPAAVRGIPTGSTLSVRFADEPGEGTPRRVASLTVVTRASSVPRTASAGAVHSVTVVLALPAGARADATTTTAVSRLVTGGVSSYWSKASDGRISFSVPKTVGWTRLTASCSDVWAIWDQAKAKTGFVPGPRRHLLVYVPPGTGCPTGLATVGASADTGGLALVGGRVVSLIAHELGHNLGLGHSDALACKGTPDAAFSSDAGFGEACQHVAYGDWYDVMGISWDNLGSLSTAHAYRLGLLGAGAVTTTRAPLRVTLRPVSGRAGLRSLRVVDPAGATYVLEYRPATGTDGWIGGSLDWRGLRAGVLLRRIDPDDPTQTLLLDATPRDTAESTDPDVVLTPGQVVKAASRRASFTVESVTPDGATVAVAVDDLWPTLVVEPRGKLINGSQVTIGQALAAWGSVAF